jgi:hypothetical protein
MPGEAVPAQGVRGTTDAQNLKNQVKNLISEVPAHLNAVRPWSTALKKSWDRPKTKIYQGL